MAGAIARNGGPCIQEESTRYVQEHGALDDGEVALTSGNSLNQVLLIIGSNFRIGGKLPAQWIIHAVGPVYSEKKKEESVIPRFNKESWSFITALGGEFGARSAEFAHTCGSRGLYEHCFPRHLLGHFRFP